MFGVMVTAAGGGLLMSAHYQGNQIGRQMPRLLSIKQATYELGISRTVLYELFASKKLASVKIKRRRFITREALEEFIAGLHS
jgi:excisionase family DNA binding protein